MPQHEDFKGRLVPMAEESASAADAVRRRLQAAVRRLLIRPCAAVQRKGTAQRYRIASAPAPGQFLGRPLYNQRRTERL